MVAGLHHDATEIKLKLLELERAVSFLCVRAVYCLFTLTVISITEANFEANPKPSVIVHGPCHSEVVYHHISAC